jgi:hypothetical protein
VLLLLALGLGLFGSPKRRKAEEIDPAKWMPILGKDPAGPARS